MLREAMETQRLPLMTADNPIALRARGGAPMILGVASTVFITLLAFVGVKLGV